MTLKRTCHAGLKRCHAEFISASGLVSASAMHTAQRFRNEFGMSRKLSLATEFLSETRGLFQHLAKEPLKQIQGDMIRNQIIENILKLGIQGK